MTIKEHWFYTIPTIVLMFGAIPSCIRSTKPEVLSKYYAQGYDEVYCESYQKFKEIKGIDPKRCK